MYTKLDRTRESTQTKICTQNWTNHENRHKLRSAHKTGPITGIDAN